MIKVISIIVAFVKFKSLGMLHTYGNKITGLILFVFVLSLAFTRRDVPIYIACAVANVSAIEELFIHLSSNELRVNRKSIFEK